MWLILIKSDNTIVDHMYNITIVMISREMCISEWPDGPLENVYDISFMIMTYFLPMISMSYTYSRYCHYHHHQHHPNCHHYQESAS